MTTVRARGADGRFVAFDGVNLKRKKNVTLTPRQRREAGEGKLDKHWRTYFLQTLAETSNVTRSAAAAKVAPSRAYKARREDPDFAAQWREALLEGYDHLEMEVLGHLRAGGSAAKLDVASAIRLLTMHRETVAAERARTENRDPQSVLDSIDAMIDQMRERRAANTLVIAETGDDDDRA
ncbi:MAG: hypothetical protein J7549_19900 [Variovorax sp.]|nr:hypothetical protein [Variovorax sp.]